MKPTQLPMQFRQGDVFIERIEAIPQKARPVETNSDRLILAHGEATGHHHSIVADAADWWRNGDEQFIEVKKPAAMEHQEHAPIPLEPGRYRVIRQREYTPVGYRQVAD